MSSLAELLPDRDASTERLLLRQFSHRINDELASVISLISVVAHRCEGDEARAALAAVHDRLQGYARIQHFLQMPEYRTTIDLAAYLQQLCRAISRTELADAGIELSLSVFPLRMSSERCWLLGMIVFEQIMNASHHVFGEGGRSIHIEIWPADGSVECCITDDGTSGQDPDGHSVSMIEALAVGLRGVVDFQSGPDGTMTVVRFPVGT